MSVSVDQIRCGVSSYILSELVPRMDSTRQFIAGTATGFLSKKADHILRAIAQKDWAQLIELSYNDGKIDLETVFESAMEQFQRQPKLPLDIPYFGRFTFEASDAQKLYNMIMNANGG